MLARLKLVLGSECDIGSYQSSNLQGVIMQNIDTGYAEHLHNGGLNPYSQYIVREKTDGKKTDEEKADDEYKGDMEYKHIWVIQTFSKEAYDNIIVPLIDNNFCEFMIEKKNIRVSVVQKELTTKEKKTQLEEFYNGECNRYIDLDILSPVSFRSNKKYVNVPDLRLIFQSLMNKYSAASDDMEMFDGETLEQLTDNSIISGYNLHSFYFPLEGLKIPSFKGNMTIKVSGTETMARYARLLFEFGEYSGIGIKTAMGMGAIRLRNQKR